MTEDKKDFVVRDRRLFAEEEAGDRKKPEKEKEEPAAAPDEQPGAEPVGQTREAADTAQTEDAPLPAINFATFVMSLNASALLHLGAIEDPATGKVAKNLPMAKQTIDILSMLEEKTRGNLTQDEETIIKNILYDLRIAYVREKE